MAIIKQQAIAPDDMTSIPLEHSKSTAPDNGASFSEERQPKPAKPPISREELKHLYVDEWQALERALLDELAEDNAQQLAAKLEEEKACLRQAWQDDISQLKSVIEGIKQFKEKKFQDMESVCVEIAFTSVLKLIGQGLAERSLINHIVNETMAEAASLHCLSVSIAKSDYQFIQQVVGEDTLELPDDVELKSDPSLAPGSCVVATQQGRLEARLDKQVEQFRQLLERIYSQESEK